MKKQKTKQSKKSIQRLSLTGNVPIIYEFREFVKRKGMRLNYVLDIALKDIINKYNDDDNKI